MLQLNKHIIAAPLRPSASRISDARCVNRRLLQDRLPSVIKQDQCSMRSAKLLTVDSGQTGCQAVSKMLRPRPSPPCC